MRNAWIRCHIGNAVVGAACLLPGVLLLGCIQEGAPPQPASSSKSAVTPVAANAQKVASPAPAAANAAKAAKEGGKTVKIGACDGGEDVEVSAELKGQALADSLMDRWKRDHPEANWVAEQKERHALKPPADNSHLLQGDQGKGHPYGNFTEMDILTWARETEKFVADGSRIFHSGDELGSSVAVSCDMCHPHAANTHPETYPKYQVQLGRVALLRDMINWCIENPVRGDKLAPDDPKMRALEAYIQSQRTGVAMNYGKH